MASFLGYLGAQLLYISTTKIKTNLITMMFYGPFLVI